MIWCFCGISLGVFVVNEIILIEPWIRHQGVS